MPAAKFCAISDIGLISFNGPDAVAFLQAQLTNDVAALAPPRTQYGGYCTPKGRLLATFLLWRMRDGILMQLPLSLAEPIRSRIAKYVLRSKVVVSDAGARYAAFGVTGADGANTIAALVGSSPATVHDVVVGSDIAVTRLPIDRYLVLTPATAATGVHERLAAHAEASSEEMWPALDVEAGIPVVTERSQEQYVPQMLNLDLIGAVSYSKGCYPGQEIVARTHYLGRVKQRTYRVQLPPGASPKVGDRLYSDEYGSDQASGTVLNVVPAPEAKEALAVVYVSAVARGIRYGALNGPAVDVLPLPYSLDG